MLDITLEIPWLITTMRNYKLISFNLSMYLILMLAVTAHAAPTVSVVKEYYSVSGNSVAEIRRNLNKETPVRIGDNRYDAYTSWHVSWNYRFTNNQSLCDISHISTHVKIKYILPKLISTLSSGLHTKWNNYYTALLQHEKGHSNFALQAAQEIEDKLATVAPHKTCSELEATANTIGYQIIDKYVQLEKAYDINTQHGATEGAYFP